MSGCLRPALAAIAIAGWTVTPGAASQTAERPVAQAPDAPILRVTSDTVRLRLVGPGGNSIGAVDVSIWADNGIRCSRAPCPTNGRQWTGRTDARGVVAVPRTAIDRVTTITAAGRGAGDVIAARKTGGTWRVVVRPDR